MSLEDTSDLKILDIVYLTLGSSTKVGKVASRNQRAASTPYLFLSAYLLVYARTVMAQANLSCGFDACPLVPVWL